MLLGTFERGKVSAQWLARPNEAILHFRQAEKEEKMADAEDGAKKKKGGVQVPEEWPWEEAKKLFQNPDVLPSSEVEVLFCFRINLVTVNYI